MDQFKIAGKTFDKPLRYVEGHVCSEAEAKRLNDCLCDVMRNNLASRKSLTQEELDRYADNYRFGMRNGSDPTMTALMAAAKAIVKKKLKGADAKTIAAATKKLIAQSPDLAEVVQKALEVA